MTIIYTCAQTTRHHTIRYGHAGCTPGFFDYLIPAVVDACLFFLVPPVILLLLNYEGERLDPSLGINLVWNVEQQIYVVHTRLRRIVRDATEPGELLRNVFAPRFGHMLHF